MSRLRVNVRGAVQGVGYRPFVFGLAERHGLSGFVLNEPAGVTIEVEGPPAAVAAFVEELRVSPPPLARVQSIQSEHVPPEGGSGFAIRSSGHSGERSVLVLPDIATCEDCLRELRDPDDRRFGYPFINCTNCGPRYTIIRDLPYDRANTTMAEFPMCADCRAEYEDPRNRRFHAEPTCCPVCGPRLWFAEPSGERVSSASPISGAIQCLANGGIVAVKGLGGFHLACDAANEDAVSTLRKRKHRDLKPFAIMTPDLAAARSLCRLSGTESAVLMAPERPIVLAAKAPGHGLAEAVAPRSQSFGVMLPYTPLHYLLMQGPCRALVMTSGNLSDEPIAHTNEDAVERLGPLADRLLMHDRPIHIRTDDSVVRVIQGAPRFLRRSRGYAPFPVSLPVASSSGEVLAVGPELSNTVCLTRGGQAFLSHHIGDLDSVAAHESFHQAAGHLSSVLEVAPSAVACDMHPGYASTRFAKERGLPIEVVQHHHAHIASVLAEHGRGERVIGVSFDGLGWGEDDLLWGGEFLVCGLTSCERAGHLARVPQPGGDAAAKDTRRMAYAFLRAAFPGNADDLARELLPEFAEGGMSTVRAMLDKGVNSPLTTSAGRLFDAASALLGICGRNHFHAQAPMELEYAAESVCEDGYYDAAVRGEEGQFVADSVAVIAGLVEDFRRGAQREQCAARFHNSLARIVLDICGKIRENTGLETLALSGGVFANRYLVERTVPLLEQAGFEVLLNAAVPPGDGGISLGQAAVAAARMTAPATNHRR